jgi:DENN (AEX-3) domain
MPLNMVEILDAPVPFLIGVHSQYLLTTPKEKRPQSVVFVDLQKDLVDLGSTSELYGTEQTPRVVEPLSKQIRMKLKAKLTEFGGCVYRQRSHVEKLRTAGTAFPSHEQLTPITDFQSNSSMSESDRTSRPSSPPSNNSRDSSPSKRSQSPDPKGDFAEMKSPANMTVLEKLLHSKGGNKFATSKNGKITSVMCGDVGVCFLSFPLCLIPC